MKTHLFTAAAMLVAALAVSPASAHFGKYYGENYAVWACEDTNDSPPVIVLDVQYVGWFFIVRLVDAYGGMWRCVADGNGEVYENEIVYSV